MKTKFLKLGLATIALVSFSYVSAQQTTGDFAKIEDASQSSVLDGTVRVIDNKGTKKFLQVKNGLTLLTNATPDGGYISTWQLGGTLTDDTYITADGNIFALDGLELETGLSSTNAVTAENAQGGAALGTGWTVIVRDEATGEIKKLLATDLIQSGQEVFTATNGQTAFPLTGAPVLPTFSQVWVYRNGAKLVSNVDYTITGSTVTLVPNTTAPNDWAVLADDVIEVQFVK